VVELLKQNPNVEVLADELTGVPNVRSLRNTVRQGGVNVLRQLGGIVVPLVRDSLVADAEHAAPNRWQGNLWLRWEPDGEQAGYYAARYVERDARR
jgi:hypothetical protein